MTRHFMLFRHCFSCLAAQFGVISSPAATCDANYVDYFSLFALFAFKFYPNKLFVLYIINKIDAVSYLSYRL